MSRANPRTTHSNAGIAAWNFKLKAEIHSYEDCKAFVKANDPDLVCAKLGPRMDVLLLGDGRLDVYEAFQHQTKNWGDIYAVRLYATEIIRYYPDGSFSVDNGGFNTPTTRERLQMVVPDGYVPYHHEKLLGLRTMIPGREVKWLHPLDHSKRILNGEILP